ncbi:MAG: hypothetical protein RI974_46 [Actinomycetota bacterium]
MVNLFAQNKARKGSLLRSLFSILAPSKGKHAKPKSAAKVTLALSAALLTLLGSVTVPATVAQALSVDASQASFNFAFPTNGTLLSGSSASANGSVVKFSNVTGTPINGISIDAIVTSTLTNATITNYDNIGNASTNTNYFQVNADVTAAYGTAVYKFDFYEANSYTGPGTGTPIVLNNVSVTSIDIDGSNNFCQFTDFTGFQSYVLSNNSSLQVQTNSTNANVPVGTTRFFATSCQNNSNLVTDAVQVQFESVTSFSMKVGTDRTSSPNYFGIAFRPISAMFGVTPASAVTNPSNQPPTSNNTTRYVTTSEPSVIQLLDFGTYQDPDSNPFVKVKITALPTAGSLEKFVNGSWVAVSLNDEISVADISNGNLRFTGAVDRSLQFKVSDGNSYSTNAYTMSLLVSTQGQSITFNNPGTKTPTSPTFSSGAVSSSGLPVTLTSLTPGVCTVSGTDITPVAAGSCTIQATQSGNSTYSAATPVSQTFPISTLSSQTITAPSPGSQTYNGSQFTVTMSPTASSNLTVTMISQSPAVCTVSGFVITILGPGNCSIRNSQGGNGSFAPAPTVEYTFAIATPAANYAITYSGNTSDGGTAPANTTGNGSVTLASNSGNLTKAGFTFGGWNTQADGNGTAYAAGASYNLTANVTLYAKWTAVAPTNYTITYDGNTSTGGLAPNSTTGNGSVTLASNSGFLAKTGYTFTGWNTQADGNGTHYNEADSYMLSADITLYAEWTAVAPTNYTITYDGNTADSGTAPANTVGNGSVTLASNSGNLTKTGFTFEGWNTQADGNGTAYATGASYNLTANVTLYAKWTAVAPTNYTITYDGNTADSGTAPANTVGNGSVTLASNSGNFAKTGYTITGWNTQADGNGASYALGASYNLTADVTLFAKWVVAYTLELDENGADSGVPPIVNNGDGTVTLPETAGTLVKEGYEFAGWNTEPDGTGISYEPGAVIVMSGNIRLFAQWVPIEEPEEPEVDDKDLAYTGSNSLQLMLLGGFLMLAGAGLTLARRRR